MGVTWIAGGAGTQADVNINNAGVHLDVAFSWNDSQGPNGAALFIIADGATSNNGGSVKITKNGEFQTGLESHYAYCSFDIRYATDRYVITSSDLNSITISLAYSIDDTPVANVVRIGGALPRTREAIQLAVDGFAAGNSLSFANNSTGVATYELDGKVDIDGVSGTEANRMGIRGTDSSGVILTADDEYPIILGTTGMNSALFHIAGDAFYYDWRFLDMDGGGENFADYCIYNPDGTEGQFHRHFNCTFHNVDLHCVETWGDCSFFYQCEFYLSRGKGLLLEAAHQSKVIWCSFHDNSSHGLHLNGQSCVIGYNLLYNNSSRGLLCEANSSDSTIMNNTVWGNSDVGIRIDTVASALVVINNTSSGNALFNWDLDGDKTHFMFFDYNHSFGGGGGLVADGYTWADVGEGNNIEGDPRFKNPAGGDFSLSINSPLRDAGVNNSDIGAVPSRNAPKPWFLDRRQRHSG